MQDGQSLDDPERLRALAATGLIDAPPSEAMQRISRLVSRLLRAPVALASFVDDERQFFVAATGFDVEPFATKRQTPLSHSFCQHVVLRGAPLSVADSREEALLDGNRAIDELGVVAYLGVPLSDPDGQLLGSLCAIDGEPRAWTAEDEQSLRDLGDLVTDELRLRRTMAHNDALTERLRQETRRDDLTGLHNRRGWREHVPMELARARRHGIPVSVILLDLDGFKAINDEQGHPAGDAILASIGHTWRTLARVPDVMARWGGDEFAVLVEADADGAAVVAARLCAAVAHLVGLSCGIAQWDGVEDADDLLARADAALLDAKRARTP